MYRRFERRSIVDFFQTTFSAATTEARRRKAKYVKPSTAAGRWFKAGTTFLKSLTATSVASPSMQRVVRLSSSFGLPVLPTFPLTSYAEYPTSLQTGRVHIIQRKEQASAMAASGQMRKTRLWFFTQNLITVEYDVVDLDYLNALRSFYDGVDGDLSTFLFQDWTNKNPVGEFCGRGDGQRQLFKIRGDSFQAVTVFTVATPGSPRVLVSPSNYTADQTTGLITMNTAPAVGVVVQADVTGEKFLCFFQGFTVKHVHSGGWLPFTVTYKGGLAFAAQMSLIQQKMVV